MIIETKFNKDDSAWVMINNRPDKIEIHNIGITVKTSGAILIEYNWYESKYMFTEDQCFPTKEELLKSL